MRRRGSTCSRFWGLSGKLAFGVEPVLIGVGSGGLTDLPELMSALGDFFMGWLVHKWKTIHARVIPARPRGTQRSSFIQR